MFGDWWVKIISSTNWVIYLDQSRIEIKGVRRNSFYWEILANLIELLIIPRLSITMDSRGIKISQTMNNDLNTVRVSVSVILNCPLGRQKQRSYSFSYLRKRVPPMDHFSFIRSKFTSQNIPLPSSIRTFPTYPVLVILIRFLSSEIKNP